MTQNINAMTVTWNNVSTTFTAIKMNVTDTASASGSMLIDLQLAGSSIFSVTKGGGIALATNVGIKQQGGSIINFYTDNAFSSPNVVFNFQGIRIRSNSGSLYFGAGDDAIITRDAANTLALRNDTNAQTFNVYNTYTSGSEYERGFARFSSNVFEIGTEAAGTGTRRKLLLDGAGVEVHNAGVYAGGFFSGRFAVANGVAIEIPEFSSAPTGSSNNARLYAEDNGAGKTRLMVIFGTGAAQQIAIEP